MEELGNMIIKFFVDYGWQVSVCAVSGIFVLGVLKLIGVFDKISNTNVKKFLYVACAFIFSAGACAAYLYIIKSFTWITFATITAPVFAINQTAYALYESMGVRQLWHKFLNTIGTFITNKTANQNIETTVKTIEQTVKANDSKGKVNRRGR